MKIRKLNILLAASIGLLALAGCTKNDGAIPKEIGIEDVPTMTTNIDATGSQSINMLNLAGFQGKFKVANIFDGTTNPTKVDIIVRKNGSNSNVKVFKTDITTFPTTITVTAAEIATLFGAAIALNDTYDFAPNTYVGSKKYEAFTEVPGATSGTGTGHNNIPGFSEYARFGAICAYDPAIYEGNFVVVKDDWADYSPGDVVVLKRESANSFSFLQIAALNPKPLVVTVNTGNNQASAPRNSVGSQWNWDARPGAFAFTTSNAAATSFVAPCDKTVTLNFSYGIDAGNFGGSYLLVLRKQ